MNGSAPAACTAGLFLFKGALVLNTCMPKKCNSNPTPLLSHLVMHPTFYLGFFTGKEIPKKNGAFKQLCDL